MRVVSAYARALPILVRVMGLSFALGACGSRQDPKPVATSAGPPPTSATAAPDAGPPARRVLRAPTDAELAGIRRALEPHVKRCFAEWAQTKPAKPVRSVFDLAYDAYGSVSAIRPAAGDPGDAPQPTVACLQSAIAQTKIEAPKDAGLALRLPFEMTPPPKGPEPPKLQSTR